LKLREMMLLIVIHFDMHDTNTNSFVKWNSYQAVKYARKTIIP